MNGPDPGHSPVPTALVLGAGGPFGWAYHLGVVAGLREVHGIEPTDLGRIVGTSAGAAIAASVLAGAGNDEVLTSVTTPPDPEDRERMRRAAAEFRKPWRRLRPAAPGLVGRLGSAGLTTAAVGLMPAGVFPTEPMRRFPIDGLDSWPEQLWVPSVRLDDGRVVVFGRDRLDVELVDALEATAAVPGMFQPKIIGDERYVDGAVSSSTHADLLIGDGHRSVVIASPMTRPGGRLVRALARRQLRAEVAALDRAGVATVVIEPGPEVMAVADGFPRSNPEAGHDIVEAAEAQTVAALISS